MAFNDYYEILGLTRNATTKDVKRNFRRLAHEFHPDRNPGDEGAEKFRKINEAYSVLSDPGKRKHYDLYGEFWKVAEDLEKRRAEPDLSGSFSRRGFFKRFFS